MDSVVPRREADGADLDGAGTAPADQADVIPAERGDSAFEAAATTGIGVTIGRSGLASAASQQSVGGPRRVVPREPKRAPHPPSRGGSVGDRLFNAVTAGFAGVILVILAGILVILIIQARDSLQHFGFAFLTGTTWDVNRAIFGAAPAIEGTVYTSLLALLLATPVGIMVAMFLTEMAPRRVRTSLGFVVELLAAVPSIVYGLWALVVLVPLVRDHIQPPLTDHFGGLPLFSGYPLGLGILSASLILAVMILPTITSISRDVMLAVPNSQRDAMLALGATRWETTWKAVVPYARSGIVGAVVLALGRAVGETMAVQMVIGNTFSAGWSLFNTATTLTATIVTQFPEATTPLHEAALIELALVLMVVTLVLNAVARLLVWRMTGREGAKA